MWSRWKAPWPPKGEFKREYKSLVLQYKVKWTKVFEQRNERRKKR